MERTIRVLWIEDDANEVTNSMIEIVEEEVRKRLYECEVTSVANIDDAFSKMNEIYIDIIFSDFNLGRTGGSGLDFLVKLRGSNNFKYYVLYSNNPQTAITKDVTDKINETQRMKLFSNFNFFSAGDDYANELDDIVQHFMDERSKIEQLRNLYIVNNAIIDEQLQSLVLGKDYFERINNFISDKHSSTICDKKTLMDLWHKIRKKRNAFAHGTQTYSNNNWEITLDNEKYDVNDVNYMDYLADISELERILSEDGVSLP